jgi:recombination associated protein RdgC
MWFKNALVYEFTEDKEYWRDEFETQLMEDKFVPCLSSTPMSKGWVSPLGEHGESLVYIANGFVMFCLQQETKLVPASVLRDEVNKKVSDLEAASHNKLKKAEKQTIKEEVYHALVTQAFSKISHTYAYIDTQKGVLVIDASSFNKAEDFMADLRKSLGTLKVQLPEVQNTGLKLTGWLKTGDLPEGFVLNDACTLKDLEEDGLIRCQKQDMRSDDIQSLIEGREVQAVSLRWENQLDIVITDELAVKSVKFLDIIKEQRDNLPSETANERFDSDFTLMTATFRGFIDS